jgi:hypothetical protein
MRRITTKMKGPNLFGPRAKKLFRETQPGQPLILLREPENPVDTNAIICCDMHGVSIGYVARTAAALVAPEMDKGLRWRAKVTGRPQGHSVTIVLWRDEPGSLDEIFRYQKELI